MGRRSWRSDVPDERGSQHRLHREPLVDEVVGAGGQVVCKPWVARNGKSFAKGDFKLNLPDLTITITCPAGETERIEFGSVVEFDPEARDHCHLRANCTAANAGTGRSVAIAENERLQHRLRKNFFDLRRACVIQNFETIQRKVA